MKNNFLFTCALALTFAVAAKSQTAPVSASKTSFNEVTAQLDPGGNFYLYLGTAQWLDRLSHKVETWRATFDNIPNAQPEQIANINKAFDIITRLITDSGVENISGLGMSSIEIEKGLYRNKVLLHHYPGQDDGFLWKMCGGAPHPLTGLDFCPANTALAIFADADLPMLWNVIQDETEKSGFPDAQKFLQQLPAQFEKSTQLKWNDVLHSLGGEFGFVITLDESNQVPIPLPSGLIQIAEPGVLLAIRVNDDTIFNRIDQELKKNQQVISVDKTGLKMRTMPLPIPIAINLRPTAASSGGYLFIASSDALVNQALAVKSGDKPGLKSTAEFKRLAQGLPDKGNQFSFMSASFGRTLLQIQQQAMTANSHNTSQAQAQWMKSLFRSDRAEFSYSIGINTSNGCLTVGNGSQSAAALVLLPGVAASGMLAAIAIPNFVKARATSQKNACINNLRQIDAAKNQWALEQGKKTGDACTEADLMPYVVVPGHAFPKCPAGGTYTINPIGEMPTCSLGSIGHRLP